MTILYIALGAVFFFQKLTCDSIELGNYIPILP